MNLINKQCERNIAGSRLPNALNLSFKTSVNINATSWMFLWTFAPARFGGLERWKSRLELKSCHCNPAVLGCMQSHTPKNASITMTPVLQFPISIRIKLFPAFSWGITLPAPLLSERVFVTGEFPDLNSIWFPSAWPYGQDQNTWRADLRLKWWSCFLPY